VCEPNPDGNSSRNEPWKIEFVQKKMKESGFQLEDCVYSIFTKHLKDSEIEQNYHFSDWETGEDRELDLKITCPVAEPSIWIDYVFLIECKQLPDNFWSFVRSRQRRMVFKNSFSVWDHVGKTGRQEEVVEILHPVFKMNEIACDTYAQTYKELLPDRVKGQPDNIKSNNRTDNIRATEIKLAKAVYFEKREALQEAEIGRIWEGAVDHIQIFYPIIVFQGNLFEANMQYDPPKVKSIGSAHLNHFSIQNKENFRMVIDVIHVDSLAQFIDSQILPEMSQVREKGTKFWESYEARVKSLRLQYTHGEIKYSKDSLL
jgi:hypothetical protein